MVDFPVTKMISSINCIELVSYFLLIGDIFCNIFDSYFAAEFYIRVKFYIIQDLIQIVTLLVLCLVLFSSEIISSGQLKYILNHHVKSLIVGSVYFILTISIQLESIKGYLKADDSEKTTKWIHTNKIFFCFFILQRFISTIYYFLYQRSLSAIKQFKSSSNLTMDSINGRPNARQVPSNHPNENVKL